MIIIKDKVTGETIKYYGASKDLSSTDSFCTNRPTGVQFRRNWGAVVELFLEMPTFTQCLLRSRYEIVL